MVSAKQDNGSDTISEQWATNQLAFPQLLSTRGDGVDVYPFLVSELYEPGNEAPQ